MAQQRTIEVNGSTIDLVEVWEYWQIARIALGGNPANIDRLNYAARQYNLAHPDVPAIRAYKALDRTRN